MAIVPFKQVSIDGGAVVVSFNYNDVNNMMTNVTITNAGARDYEVFITDGGANTISQQNGTGFAIAVFGEVEFYTDGLTPDLLPKFPDGITYYILERNS